MVKKVTKKAAKKVTGRCASGKSKDSKVKKMVKIFKARGSQKPEKKKGFFGRLFG